MNEESPRGHVAQEVRALLRERIESFEHLEALLLLHKHRDRPWAPQDVAERLNIQTPEVEAVLHHLRRNSLVDVRSEGEAALFIYRPEDPDLSNAVERLSRDYEDSRVEIMRLMSKNTIERLRTQTLRLFADAFVLGRKKDG